MCVCGEREKEAKTNKQTKKGGPKDTRTLDEKDEEKNKKKEKEKEKERKCTKLKGGGGNYTGGNKYSCTIVTHNNY
jgi:hypothetical protein